MEFPSYPKVYTLGHKEIAGIFDTRPLYIQEKIDGSQINFRWDEQGVLHVKSKGGWQYGGPDNRIDADQMFKKGLENLLALPAQDPSYIFRGEYLSKPKHNALAYDRVPDKNIILFDIVTAGWEQVYPWTVVDLPLEWVVPVGIGGGTNEQLHEIIEIEMSKPPILGGPMREGVVVKNYDVFDRSGKPMFGKRVNPQFKEIHEKEWGASNPSKRDVVQAIIDSLNTEARFAKAVQHLREAGQLEGTPRDIGALIKEIKRDTIEEARDYIVERLIAAFMPDITRGIGRGAAEWYKDVLYEESK